MRADFQPVSDGELARRSQAGSAEAFEELVYRYEGRIYGFLLKSCGNDTDARELTQDTFVRAFQAILQFDLRRDFAPWLFTIARRKLIDRARARRPISDEPVPDSPDFFDPAEALAQNEDAQNLWAIAKRHLPETQFQALWLRYVEDMDVTQIAKVLRRTNTSIKVLLFRARNALRKRLKQIEELRSHPERMEIIRPRVPRNELPWEVRIKRFPNSERVASPEPILLRRCGNSQAS